MEKQERRTRSSWWRVALLMFWLYLFLSSINMMGAGFKLMGKGFSNRIVALTTDPVAGLMVGVLTTAIVQSSSLVTSIVVGLVGSGMLSLDLAVPVIMGANIGTTVTATLVAMGYVGRRGRFRRAFAAATMHDFFNILTVLVLFPIEQIFHPLQRSATFLAGIFANFTHFDNPASPVTYLLSRLEKSSESLLMNGLKCGNMLAATIMVIVALVLLFLSLYYLTRTIKALMAGTVEAALDRFIFRRTITAFAVGLMLTATIQSSSVTTSLMVPLVTAGILTLEQVYPYTLGANIGTTVTAVMAAIAMGQPLGLAIALTHTLFNCAGVCIFLPIPKLNRLPVFLARTLAALTLRSRWYAVVYILVVFFLIPCIFIFLW